jgi:hypothetical protein
MEECCVVRVGLYRLHKDLPDSRHRAAVLAAGQSGEGGRGRGLRSRDRTVPSGGV